MYRTSGVCLMSIYTFLASKSSPSPASGLRHSSLWLHITNLGSNIFSMWMNLQLLHCKCGQQVFYNMQRNCICNSCPRAAFFSYGTQWLNDSANVGCFIAAVCGLQVWTSHSEQQWYMCLFERLKQMCLSTVFSHNSLWKKKKKIHFFKIVLNQKFELIEGEREIQTHTHHYVWFHHLFTNLL